MGRNHDSYGVLSFLLVVVLSCSSSFDRVMMMMMMMISVVRCEGGDDRQYPCTPARCSDLLGPEIRFPFRLKGQQPERCGYPGFELTCNGSNTILHLPSSQNLTVTEIFYYDSSMSFANPYKCTEELLLKLNLSASPFRGPTGFLGDYFNFMADDNRTSVFVDCSITMDSTSEISCLSSRDHHVFLVDSDTDLAALGQASCGRMGTVEISNLVTQFLTGETDPQLYLSWHLSGCKDCAGTCRYKNGSTHQTECYDPFVYPRFYGYYDAHDQKGAHIKHVIIGVCVPFFCLIVAAIIASKVYQYRRADRKKEMENQLKVEKFLEDYKFLKPTRYSYIEIKRMTNLFRHKIGQGGFGTVFKGKLPNGILVAVKVLEKCTGGGGEDFINEVGTIGRIHHVNVVRLLGFCAEGFERALIYEFMPNQSLEKFIFSLDGTNALLGWEKLQEIAVGIAKGIEYLHQGCDHQILHFDIKPHNILLDQNFNPKISDFGLAKLCLKDQSNVSMTAAKGTMGYIAPEVFSRNFGNVSHKADVYSFGMVLLEMVGGRRNTNTAVENTSEVYFPEWIYNRLHRGDELGLRIVAGGDAMISKKLTIVALWCIQWYPIDRPSMKSVVQMLEGSMENLAIPPNPFGSTSQPTTNEMIPENLGSTPLTVITE